MNPVRIRGMKPEDREAVVALLQDSEPWIRLGYTHAEWMRYFSLMPEGRDAFVAEEAGTITGIAVLRQKFLLGDYLELFGVAAASRGAGTGSTLLAHVESVAFGRGKNLFACVSDFNQPARAFYRKRGYREIGPLPDLLIRGSAEILIRKTTGPARSA